MPTITKKFLLAIILLLHTALCFAQKQKLTEAGLGIELPNAKWGFKSRQETNGLVIYTYKREHLGNVIPNISFIIEPMPDTTDLVVYSMDKRARVKFEVEAVFDHNTEDHKITYNTLQKNIPMNSKNYEETHPIRPIPIPQIPNSMHTPCTIMHSPCTIKTP